MRSLPHVDLIMPNWNARSLLGDSLSSLLELDYPDFSLSVIDNASTDDSVQFIRRHFPEVRLYCNERNLGFAAGVNVGLRVTEGEIVVLLNPDISVHQDWLRQLVSVMLDDPSIGIAGCRVYYPDGRLQHAGGYISYPRANPGHYGLKEEERGQYNALRDVDYVIGAALAVRRQALDSIGLLDEGFFLYYEDVDLCVRARRAGFRVVYVPQAEVVHQESAVSQKGSDAYLEHMHSSRWRFLLKHYDLEDILRDTVPAELVWLDGITARHRRAAAKAYALALRRLPAIAAARKRDGGPRLKEMSEDQSREIAEGLQTLRHAAMRPVASSLSTDSAESQERERSLLSVLERLKASWRIEERPFVSHVPVFGPVIVRFRETWNSIATKWFVRPLVQQQNEFNALVTDGLKELDKELGKSIGDLSRMTGELDARTIDNDREATAMARKVGELTYAVIRLEKRLAALETLLKDEMAERS